MLLLQCRTLGHTRSTNMSDKVIPMPRPDEVSNVRSGTIYQAEKFGLDLESTNVQDFVDHEITIKTQMSAEIRWLRHMLRIHQVHDDYDVHEIA